MRASFIATALLAANSAFALTRSPDPTLTGGLYVVDSLSKFTNASSFVFAGLSALPDGLYTSVYSLGTHQYTSSNVYFSNPYLVLRVPGGQTAQPYSAGEVCTVASNIKYASVRTVAIFSEPAGVCNGIFYYFNDTQETDIEWLSDKNSLSNGGTRKLWLTNQDANLDGSPTSNAITPPTSPTSTEHEYRIDWTPGLTRWYVDGVQVWSTTGDVPSTPGSWIFNNWSNGDKGWSAGPPASAALFKIRDIKMYFNVSSS